MAISDIISGIGIEGSFKNSFVIIQKILDILLNLLVISLILSPILYIIYYFYRTLKFKIRVLIFAPVGDGVKYRIDWGREIINKNGTIKFELKSKKTKNWKIPIPPRDAYMLPDGKGASTLILQKFGAGDTDLKWLNPSDFYKGVKINLIDASDRREFVLAHRDIEKSYTLQTTFQKYQHIIVPIAFGVLFVGIMVFAMIYISEMWQVTVQQAGALGDKIAEASKDLVQSLERARG